MYRVCIWEVVRSKLSSVIPTEVHFFLYDIYGLQVRWNIAASLHVHMRSKLKRPRLVRLEKLQNKRDIPLNVKSDVAAKMQRQNIIHFS